MKLNIIRSDSTHIPQLKAIWEKTFHDTEDYIDLFFEKMYTPGCAVMAIDGEKIVSVVYSLNVGDLILDSGDAYPCNSIYAVSTEEKYRGRGLAPRLIELAAEKTAVTVVCPASSSLFNYYSEKTGFKNYFFTNEANIPRDYFLNMTPKGRIGRISPDDYGKIREAMLKGRSHIRFSSKTLNYKAAVCRQSGGDLFVLDFGGKGGCCAVEIDGNTASIKEMLVPDGYAGLGAALAATAVPAESYILRAPSEKGDTDSSYIRPFGMAQGFEFTAPDSFGEHLPWYGFAFD